MCSRDVLFCAAILVASHAAYAVDSSGDAEVHGRFRKDFADPCLGQRWRLVFDTAHPGGPGRLILLDAQPHLDAQAHRAALTSSPAIRSGDRITVVQDRGVVRARLQAVALESAAVGQPLRARLTVSTDRRLGGNVELTAPGPVISVVVQGTGLARWAPALSTNAAAQGEVQ